MTMTSMGELVGDSPAIVALREEVRRLLASLGAGRLPPVLIEGETGTGKGLLARLLHRGGPRAAGPFIAINCAAIPETLLESEMFGYERGAFTDAHQPKSGLLEAAQHGTFFLDEVGLLPEGVQGKLLKAIEDREVRRLGATRSIALDVWIIAATSEDLAAARQAGRFQEALVVERSLRMADSLVTTVAADSETLAALEILRVRSVIRLSQATWGVGARP